MPRQTELTKRIGNAAAELQRRQLQRRQPQQGNRDSQTVSDAVQASWGSAMRR